MNNGIVQKEVVSLLNATNCRIRISLDRCTTCSSTEFENAEKRNIFAASHVDTIEAENEPSRLAYNLVILKMLVNK